jgi:hypothetical protein
MRRIRQAMLAGGVSRETISRLLNRRVASWDVRYDGNPGEASV